MQAPPLLQLSSVTYATGTDDTWGQSGFGFHGHTETDWLRGDACVQKCVDTKQCRTEQLSDSATASTAVRASTLLQVSSITYATGIDDM